MTSYAEGPIAKQYATEDGDRSASLNRARECAALIDPSILPPAGQSPEESEPEQFQSLGSRGMTNMTGRMLLALYPPSQSWFRFELSDEIADDPSVPDETKQTLADQATAREALLLSLLEGSDVNASAYTAGNVRQSAFRSQKDVAIKQCLCTGDVLENLTSDWRIKVFGRDMYVTCRNSSGDVLYHIIKERVDPLSLTEEQRARGGFDTKELKATKVFERMADLYTYVEWNPLARVWTVAQEANAREIASAEQKISAFFSTPYSLSPRSHYGRGFVEKNRGDLHSYNELCERLLDFAVLASKHLWVIDKSSNLRDVDLAKPSGSVLVDTVVNGVATKVGMLQANKLADFSVVERVAEGRRKELAKAMLIESEVIPQQERTTAVHVNRIVQELQGALGGPYAAIAEQQQLPLVRRMNHQAVNQGLLRAVPDGVFKLNAVTGIVALGRAQKAQEVLSFAGAIAQLGPEAMKRLNVGVLVQVLKRQQGIDEPGLVKTDKQIEQEVQAAIRAQTQAIAAEKAVEVGGNLVEAGLNPNRNAPRAAARPTPSAG